MKIFVWTAVVAVCLLAVGFIFLIRIQLYSKQQLAGVKLERSGTGYMVVIPLLESIYTPALVQSRLEGDTIAISIYKQLSSPLNGPFRAALGADNLKESLVHIDSKGRYVGKIFHFNLQSPKYVLRAKDGDIPIEVMLGQ